MGKEVPDISTGLGRSVRKMMRKWESGTRKK